MHSSIRLSKSSYSEQSVRKALYWLSEHYRWKLDEDGDSWNIDFIVEEKEFDVCKSEFDRLLNDFVLREKLDKNTKHLRQKIIASSLKRLVNDGINP